MNEFKGTPGPWSVDKCRYDYVVCAYGSGEVVVQTQDEEGRYGAIAKEADANLIAAAPELLEAAMLAREHIADEFSNRAAAFFGHEKVGRVPKVKHDLDIIDTAIAKALGRYEENA